MRRRFFSIALLFGLLFITQSFDCNVMEAFDIKVYPNPASGETINVKVEPKNPSDESELSSVALKISLLDINGREIRNKTAGVGENISFTVAQLPNGAYLIKIEAISKEDGSTIGAQTKTVSVVR